MSNENSGDEMMAPFHAALTEDDTNAFNLHATLESELHVTWGDKNPT